MKVAMVTPWKVRCGIYTYSEHLAFALAEEDVEVDVVRLPRFGMKSPDLLQMVARHYPKDADVIHVQHEYGLYQTPGNNSAFFNQLKFSGKPIVTTMHAVGNWPMDAVVMAASKRVIVHNDFCYRNFTKFLDATPVMLGNVVIIPHGTALMECTPQEKAKQSYGIDIRAPMVGYLGFISNYKGLETLIQAMTKVKAGLLMAGGWHLGEDTDYITNLKEWSLKTLPGKVQWTGFVEDDRLADAYGAMDVFVYPSYFATESGALLTALGYGKAIVASNVKPFKEKEKEGALMTFKGPDDLARKINRLLRHKELRAKLEEGAKRYAEKTSWSNVAKQHCKLYEEVAA